jgi:hypothetical protein
MPSSNGLKRLFATVPPASPLEAKPGGATLEAGMVPPSRKNGKPAFPPRPSLSKSSMGEFNDCERKWAYHYAWSDFDYFDFPPPLKRNCHFHSKLMGNEAFAGQVVHDVIDETLRGRVEGSFPFDPHERAREIAREYLDVSNRVRDAFEAGHDVPRDLKRQPLVRHFFREGFDGHAKAEFRKLMDGAILNFFESELAAWILSLDPAYYELPPHGSAPWFMEGDVPVYANFDFALRMPDRTILFDWKTGKISPRADADVKEQLHTYAAYAISQWGASPSELRLVAVWLSAGKDQKIEMGVETAYLDRLRKSWQQRHRVLCERREKARGNMDKLFQLFPMTGIEKKRCRKCAFRFCEGYAQYLESVRKPKEEPAAS